MGNKRGENRIINETSLEIDKTLINFACQTVREAKDINAAIYDIFNMIGNFYHLSYITVFEHEIIGRTSQFTYQWSNSEMITDHHSVSIRITDVIEYENQYDENGVFYIDEITVSNPSLDTNLMPETIGAKALIQNAIFDFDRNIGAICYVDCLNSRKWSSREKETLHSLTKFISNYIVRQRNKQELENDNFFTQAILNNQKLNNYAVKDGTYELLYCSQYTTTLFPNAKVGEMCYKAIFGREQPCDPCPVIQLVRNQCSSFEGYDKNKNIWYSTKATNVTMLDGQKINLVCTTDVTGFMKRVHAKDYLTGLRTLTTFKAEAMKLLAETAQYSYAVLYVDIDKFKNINDRWGYTIGDEVLVNYARILNDCILPNELICRVSEDKFLLFLRYMENTDILIRIQNANSVIFNTLHNKFPKINCNITGGIYYLTPDDKVLSIAIDKANLARKTVKGFHKSKIAIYDQSLHMQISKEKMIESNMYEALNNNEFIVYMQPKVDLKTNQIIGAEALVRWQQPSGNMISPADFIPVFEKNGFISELDFYVYEETMIFLRNWLDMGRKPLVLSINVSKLHINDSDFIIKLENLIEKYKIPPQFIELELTESIFFKELDRLVNILNYLKTRGFLISIDDFGSGYSSLNILKTLPVDILKIDRDFFRQNHMENQDKTIISSIVIIAKGLGLKVISEGIETEEQVSFLKENKCDMAQGYWFYRPMPMQEFMKLVI